MIKNNNIHKIIQFIISSSLQINKNEYNISTSNKEIINNLKMLKNIWKNGNDNYNNNDINNHLDNDNNDHLDIDNNNNHYDTEDEYLWSLNEPLLILSTHPDLVVRKLSKELIVYLSNFNKINIRSLLLVIRSHYHHLKIFCLNTFNMIYTNTSANNNI